MIGKFLITITIINSVGKSHEIKVIENDKIGVSRTIINFVPIRGYEAVAYLVTPYEELI